MHLTLAVSEECEVLGYVLLSVIADESEILNIAVAPLHRREGIGKQLLESALCEARSRGAENCYLEVRASNESAIHLYTFFGFTKVGLRKQYYTKPKEDAVLMCCPLKKEESYAAFSH
jgi:ribosomal-protein-alanine N-acetyltransferase